MVGGRNIEHLEAYMNFANDKIAECKVKARGPKDFLNRVRKEGFIISMEDSFLRIYWYEDFFW